MQHTTLHRTTQYNIPYNTLHYTVQHSTLYHTTHYIIPYNTLHYTVQHTTLYRTTHYTIPYNTLHYTIQHTTLYHTTHYTTTYHNCIHSRLPEDEPLGSKHVEDITNLNINLEKLHFFASCCTATLQCTVYTTQSNFNITHPSVPSTAQCSLSFNFATNKLHAFFFSPVRATCLTHLGPLT